MLVLLYSELGLVLEPSAQLGDTNLSIPQIVINLQMSVQEEVEPRVDALGT